MHPAKALNYHCTLKMVVVEVNVPVYISVKQYDASWIALPCVKTMGGHQVQRLNRSCSTILLPLSISSTCIWSSEGSSDQDPQQAAEARITDQGVSERGQSLWGWVLTKTVFGSSVGELKSSNLFSRGEKLHVTTSFMEMMGKVRPQPSAKAFGDKKKYPMEMLGYHGPVFNSLYVSESIYSIYPWAAVSLEW